MNKFQSTSYHHNDFMSRSMSKFNPFSMPDFSTANSTFHNANKKQPKHKQSSKEIRPSVLGMAGAMSLGFAPTDAPKKRKKSKSHKKKKGAKSPSPEKATRPPTTLQNQNVIEGI
jgi:hypothetical protein